MQPTQVIDVIEAVLGAAEHPDIVRISRYGTETSPGVKATHGSGAEAMIWDATGVGAPTPVLAGRR